MMKDRKGSTMQRVHKEFSKTDRQLAKAKHEQFKRNQPQMAEEQRNKFIRSIVNSKEVNLPIGKVILNKLGQ